MDFPLFNTKELGTGKKYNLNDPAERREYFKEKAGKEIEVIKEYIDREGFLAIMLAKKSAGKGTYAKMFAEIVGDARVSHISIGDLVRSIYELLSKEDSEEKKAIKEYFSKNYRGFMPLEEAVEAFLNKTQEKLIPTEFILTLVKMEIEKVQGKAIFLDGFPRNLDQISYSLYFREIMNLAVGPDFFVLLDVPEKIIDERIKTRTICPVCHTSRNTKLLPTKFVEYDEKDKSYYLVCDNSSCEGYGKTRMVQKEGDNLGIEPIRKRLEMDGELIEKVATLHGVAKIKVRNHVPVSKSNEVTDLYELTPEFYYEKDATGKVITKEKPWTVIDDENIECNSLMAPACVLSMVHQMHSILTTGENKIL